MAAGLNHLIVVENSSFAIYDKTGVLQIGPILFDNILGVSGTFDPTVMYDSEDDRYVMGIEDGAKFYLMVSNSSDPTGTWTYYAFDARFYGDEFFDYPHIGIGDHLRTAALTSLRVMTGASVALSIAMVKAGQLIPFLLILGVGQLIWCVTSAWIFLVRLIPLSKLKDLGGPLQT